MKIPVLPNPYLIVAVLLAIGGAFWYGTKVGTDGEVARQARIDAGLRRIEAAAERGAARATIQTQVTQKTIQNKAVETIRENTIYRDCVNDPVMQRLLDAARANRAPESLGDRELPAGSGTSAPR